MKRVKRFSTGDEVEYFGSSIGKSESSPAASSSESSTKSEAPAKKQSFSEAFAAARARGDKDFAWEGKPGMRFSTKMREDKPASKAESAPSKPAPKAEEPAKPTPKTEESKRGIGPYNVFSGPADADPEAVKAAKAAGDARRAKQAAAPMLHNPFRGAIDALRERGKKSNPDAYAKGGSVSSASKRADGIAQRGKTRGKMC